MVYSFCVCAVIVHFKSFGSILLYDSAYRCGTDNKQQRVLNCYGIIMENTALLKGKIKKFWIRLAVFIPVLSAILLYAIYVITPKYDYGICSMTNFYMQPENTVDVLFVGTSQTYGGVNHSILWDDYGIASYSLATAEQAYWTAYYYICEALKAQSPKLIVLDAKSSTYPDDYSRVGRTIMSTFGIMSPGNRIAAITECAGMEERDKFLLAFPVIHSYAQQVTWNSFLIPPDNEGRGNDWKGFIEHDETEQHERPSLVWTKTKMAVNEHELEYFNKILSLCEEKSIPVLLVSYPYPDYANDHMYVNSLFTVAEEYGIEGVNYNNPDLRFGLRYSSDFADWQHLNLKGSTNFTRKLGEDIKEMLNIPDRRGESGYESYDRYAEYWFAQYPQYRTGYTAP